MASQGGWEEEGAGGLGVQVGTSHHQQGGLQAQKTEDRRYRAKVQRRDSEQEPLIGAGMERWDGRRIHEEGIWDGQVIRDGRVGDQAHMTAIPGNGGKEAVLVGSARGLSEELRDKWEGETSPGSPAKIFGGPAEIDLESAWEVVGGEGVG